MKTPEKAITLGTAEIKDVSRRYREMSDLVQCYTLCMSSALDLARRHPEKLEAMCKTCENAEEKIRVQLDKFKEVLDKALHMESA